jgi:transcriptional regulator with XRE-family HTH domain
VETFGNRLRLLREAKGLRQEDIGDIFGFGKSTISQWEKGTREPDFSVVVKLAEYFQVSTDDLLGKKLPVSTGQEGLIAPAQTGQEGSIVSSAEDTRKIPIYDIGNRDEIFAQTNIIGYVPISADIMADYAISMNDDSMLPSIKPEAKVIIRAQETFSNGQAVLAQLPEGTYTIRRATQTDEGGIILTPDNSSYAPQHYNSANLRILGIVTHLITDFT